MADVYATIEQADHVVVARLADVLELRAADLQQRAMLEDDSFGAVVCHTSLCHIPEPNRVLAEASRVTGAGGLLADFDGDYATTTVAICDHDPLQACADAAMEALVRDRRLVRRLPTLVREAGYEMIRLRSRGYSEAAQPSYMLTIVDRGADALVSSRRLGAPAAAALKAEARRRERSSDTSRTQA